MLPAFTLDDIRGFLALVFQMAKRFIVGAKWIDVFRRKRL
jgi:hypothetical protein